MTMTFVILLRAYFLMFRQIKILIFNSRYTTDDICYPLTMLICFVTEFDDWTFKMDRQYVSQQQICYKKKVCFNPVRTTTRYIRYIKYVCAEWHRKTRVCRFLFIDPLSLKKINLQVDNVSFLNLTNSIYRKTTVIFRSYSPSVPRKTFKIYTSASVWTSTYFIKIVFWKCCLS